MKTKKTLFAILLASGISLPTIASEFTSNSGNETNIQQYDVIEAEDSASTKSDDKCWVWIPGWGWYYIC